MLNILYLILYNIWKINDKFKNYWSLLRLNNSKLFLRWLLLLVCSKISLIVWSENCITLIVIHILRISIVTKVISIVIIFSSNYYSISNLTSRNIHIFWLIIIVIYYCFLDWNSDIVSRDYMMNSWLMISRSRSNNFRWLNILWLLGLRVSHTLLN